MTPDDKVLTAWEDEILDCVGVIDAEDYELDLNEKRLKAILIKIYEEGKNAKA